MAELPFILKAPTSDDLVVVERLNARAFGPGRYARSAYRLREGMPADPTLSFIAWIGTLLVGAILMTPIRCGQAPALLLGPLTVDPAFQKGGIGEALALRALSAARDAGHALVLLVGDEPYYSRIGFARVPDGQLEFCGPVDPARLLYRELVPGTFGTVTGKVRRALPA